MFSYRQDFRPSKSGLRRLDKDKNLPHEKIGGFSRLTAPLLRAAFATAFAGAAIEVIMQELMEDSRISRRLAHLEGLLHKEFDFLQKHVHFKTWAVLALAADESWSGPELKNQTLLAVLLAWGFMEWRFLKRARGFPWCLNRGDLRENLAAFKARPKPAPGIPRQIWVWMALEFPCEEVAEAVDLLDDIEWDAKGAEDGHGSASVMTREQPGVGADVKLARSTLHHARPLVREAVPPQQLVNAEARLRKVQRQQPEKKTGRQLFFEELCTGVRNRLGPKRSVPHL